MATGLSDRAAGGRRCACAGQGSGGAGRQHRASSGLLPKVRGDLSSSSRLFAAAGPRTCGIFFTRTLESLTMPSTAPEPSGDPEGLSPAELAGEPDL
jgi:hypothetical protein